LIRTPSQSRSHCERLLTVPFFGHWLVAVASESEVCRVCWSRCAPLGFVCLLSPSVDLIALHRCSQRIGKCDSRGIRLCRDFDSRRWCHGSTNLALDTCSYRLDRQPAVCSSDSVSSPSLSRAQGKWLILIRERDTDPLFGTSPFIVTYVLVCHMSCAFALSWHARLSLVEGSTDVHGSCRIHTG
jgi:hypothetical protein